MTGIRSNVIYIGGQKISASGNSLYVNDIIVAGVGGGGGVNYLTVTGLAVSGNLELTGNSNLNPFVSGGKVVFNTFIDGTLPTGQLAGTLILGNPKAGSASSVTRGNGSIDLQTSRLLSSQTSVGNYSAILGGSNNRVANSGSIIIGGNLNFNSGNRSLIGNGIQNSIASNASYSSILNGSGNSSIGSVSTIVNGINNFVSGNNNFIGGGLSNKISGSALQTTYSFIGNGNNHTVNSTNGAIIAGAGNTAGYKSLVGNGTNNRSLGNYSAIVNGWNNKSYGSQSVIIGGYNNTISATTAQQFIGIGVGNRLSCYNGVILAGGYNKLGQVSSFSSAYNAILQGRTNIVSGCLESSVVNGRNNIISGFCTGSIILNGRSNYISGSSHSAIIFGTGNLVQANFASAKGNMAEATRWGEQSFSSFPFNSQRGSAQKVSLIGQAATTSEIPVVLLNGFTTGFFIETGKGFAFTANIFGARSGGADMAQYIRQGIIKNVAGTTSIVGTVNTIGTDIESNPLTNVVITANDTTDTLSIAVSGVNGQNWRWLAQLEGVEIKF